MESLGRATSLGRAGRRQYRKLLGRIWGLEWRVFGNVKRGLHLDPLNAAVLARAKELGHVAQRLAGR